MVKKICMAIVSLILLVFILGLGREFKPMLFPSCPTAEKVYKDTQSEFTVESLNYISNQEAPVILIIPPTGGVNILDRGYADYLCKKGFNTIILKKWTGDDEVDYDLSIHQRFYERTQKAISLVIEQTQSPFFGILGTSVGGIHASVAIKFHDKLKAAFIIAGGAPIASVIVHSDQKVLVDAKEKRFGMYNFKNTEEYEKALSDAIFLDPFKLPNKESKPVAMVIAEKDVTVPVEYQNKLKEHLKPEKIFAYSNNHFWAIIKSWLFLKPDIVKFFSQAQQENS